MKALMRSLLALFGCCLCSLVVGQQVGFGTGNPPATPEPVDLIVTHERDVLEENEQLILRTIKFMISETSVEDYVEQMGELIPSQTDFLKQEFKEFTEKAEELRQEPDSFIRDFERSVGRPATEQEVELLVDKAIKQAEAEFYTKITEEMLQHQKLAIAKWNPSAIGIASTLVDTPIGKAIGLSDREIKKLRERSEEISIEYFEAYKKAKLETYKLFEEILDERQAQKIKDLYYPGRVYSSSQPSFVQQMPFAWMRPVDLFRMLPREYDYSIEIDSPKK